MSDNNCNNNVASQLTADTFIGKDCGGNTMNAGSTFASCADLAKINLRLEGIPSRESIESLREQIFDFKATASSALTKAELALDQATTASNNATEAKTNASVAKSTADNALQTATSVSGTATEALTKAEVSSSKAETALSTATIANQNANSADTKAELASTKADNAYTIATEALTKANESILTSTQAQTKAEQALQQASDASGNAIVQIATEGNLRHIKMQDGSKFTFSVADAPITNTPTNDVRAVSFAPEGDTIVITMSDGNKLDLTRQQFADWLTEKDSSLASDQEIQQIIEGGNNQVIQELNDRINNLEYDQAVLTRVDDNLVLTNDDGTTSTVSLNGLVKLSDQNGNLLELRDDGLYYGILAAPNLANLYVDAENGDDSRSIEGGGGSVQYPFKTLEKAFQVTPKDKSNTIRLKSSNSSGNPNRYAITSPLHSIKGGAIRMIVPYGDPVYDGEVGDCYRNQTNVYSPQFADEVVRPVIYLNWYDDILGGQDIQRTSRIDIDNGEISFFACTLELSAPTLPIDDYTVSGNYARSVFTGSGTINLTGCNIDDNAPQYVRFYAGTARKIPVINFLAVNVDSERMRAGDQPFINIGGTSGTINSSTWSTVYQGDINGCQELTLLNQNMTAFLQEPNAISGIVRQSATGIPLNLSSNFEV